MFILLLVGHEAARVSETLEKQTVFAQVERTQHKAANDREMKRQTQGVNVDSLIQEIAARDIGRNVLNSKVKGEEIARGKLAYSSGLFDDYDDVYTILRQADSAGKAYLDLYFKEKDCMLCSSHSKDEAFETAFRNGLPIDRTPDKHMTLYADSFVGVEKELGFIGSRSPGLRVHAEKYGKNQNYFLKVLEDYPSIRVRKAGKDEWVPFDGQPIELATAWLQTIKTVQALGTGLTDGTSLVQCTYVASTDSCSTPEFCKLQEADTSHTIPVAPSSRKWCKAVTTSRDNLVAWQEFATRSQLDAKEIADSGCVSSCRSKWEKAMDSLSIITQMIQKFKDINSEDPAALSKLVVNEAAQDILLTGDVVKETIVNSLSKAWDDALTGTVSSLRLALRFKGCPDMKPGVFKSFLNLKHRSESADSNLEEEQAEFMSITEGCEWFRELGGGGASLEQIVNAESHAEKVVAQNKAGIDDLKEEEVDALLEESKQIHKDSPHLAASSALQTAIEPATVTAIVVGCVVAIVVGLLLILLGRILCKFATGFSKPKTPAELCAKQEGVETCAMITNRIGTFLFIAGIIVIVVIIILAAAKEGGSGGSSSSGGGATVIHHHHYYGGYGGSYYGGGFLWYTPPYYYYGYHDPYYRTRFVSDYDIEHFDMSKCLKENEYM
jgi:uncharacterized membrane protein